jgi:hypothetical protein
MIPFQLFQTFHSFQPLIPEVGTGEAAPISHALSKIRINEWNVWNGWNDWNFFKE